MQIEEQAVSELIKKRQTLAVAESCTGGMLGSAIVSVSGASECFEEGYITYSNEAKIKNLNVSSDTLKTFGAVSKQVASQMAEGVRARNNASYGLATTGIAGPGGGTPEKPVGLVYIACAAPNATEVRECHFSGDRQEIRTQAVSNALQLLLECIGK